jgi:hypothetical protein
VDEVEVEAAEVEVDEVAQDTVAMAYSDRVHEKSVMFQEQPGVIVTVRYG